MHYFVTGTDTGVGKTHVTSQLIGALRARGRDAFGLKPVETGWDELASDARALALQSGRTIDQTVRSHYAAARSPRASAAREERTIDVAELAEWCTRQVGEVVLIEGAGGWMVPLTRTLRIRDLAVAIGAPVLIVARAGLGTVNHSILTVEAIRATSEVFGLVLSRRPDDDLAFARENAAEIRDQTGVRVALVPDDLSAVIAWFSPEPGVR